MGNCFHIRRSGGGETTCSQPVWNSLLRQSRLAEMTGDQLRLRFDKLWKQRFDRRGNPRVQLLSASLEQAFVGGVAHQGVLEDVGSGRREASPENELCCNQAIKRCGEFRLWHRHDRRKQLVIELAANTGSDLRDLLHRSETVEPRHQRIVQRRRDRQTTGVVQRARSDRRCCGESRLRARPS